MNTGMTGPDDFKKTAEFDVVWNSQMCVCLCAPCWSLFLHVEHCLLCCAALCRARGNHNDWGFKTLCSCWESLERFFSPSSCSLTVFSFPLSCYSLIALSFSFPYNLPQHKHTHTLLLPHFSFSWQMQFSEATQSNMTCSKCYPHLNRCHKYNGNLNVWRFLIKIILCNYNI